MSRYSDSVSGGRQSGSSGADYTDRFRVDGSFPSDSTTSSHSSLPKPTSALLVTLIERACAPHLHEPNLALNLEIADIINQKKGTIPRIAAINIVKLINDKNSHVAILAVGVLDICVKNCGYPFHLQISRKEFLNEFVRRFPEKPPAVYTRVQSLILQQLQEWWETICCTSKYKDDLGYIRDMHRLLSFKGYVFPEISLSDAAVLNPSENFQSASEMEKEEREAQEAKLQELIRRGTPADLQEANRLMKIMSGFQESFTNYRAKVAEEVDKLRSKSELLEEMLNNAKPGDSIQDDDVYSEIVSTLKTSQPKIEKMVDEEKDDEEAVIKLLALNDRIQALLEKYRLLKSKDYAGASNIKIEGASATASTKTNTSVSLIDFDDGPSTPTTSPPASTPSANLLDQLNSLSFSSPSISLPLSANATGQSVTPTSQAPNTNLVSTPSQLPISPNSPSAPDYSAFKSLSPALNSPSSSDWTFSSAPTYSTTSNSTPSHQANVLNDSLKLIFTMSRDSPSSLEVKASFSNTSASLISNINLQLAVPRSFNLQMQPQSSTLLAPFATSPITQVTTVDNVTKGTSLKIRWRVTATLGTASYERQGVIDDIPNTL